ncbi:MAG: Flagellar hook-associated protein 3 [Pseudomonadota bacterium]|jgi:flagellar hook-associated protein 3 FlgL
MKISTGQFFDRAVLQMGDRQGDLSKVQAQLATGKQIVKPSDEPDRAAAVLRIKSVVDRQDRHLESLVAAKNRLGVEEGVLTDAGDLLARIKELALQAANGTYDPGNREVIAIEIDGMREQLLSLANARDTQDNYLFAGTRTQTRPFQADAQGTIVYLGDQTRVEVAVGDHRDLNMNRSGTDVFTSLERPPTEPDGPPQTIGFFEALQDLSETVRRGTEVDMQRGLGELDQMVQNIAYAVSEVGTDRRVAEMQTEMVEETQLQMRAVLSNVEDLDYAEAVTRMQKQVLALEAAQRSFAQISRLSLFEYLR